MCSRTAYQMIQTGRTRSHSRGSASALTDAILSAESFRCHTWNNFGRLNRRFDGFAHLRLQAAIPVLKVAAKRLDACPQILLAGVGLCDHMGEHGFRGRPQIRLAAWP